MADKRVSELPAAESIGDADRFVMEQGGEAKSVAFCNKVGLNYVSCSPFRVPIARLAAAQAAIKG